MYRVGGTKTRFSYKSQSVVTVGRANFVKPINII